MKLFLLQQNVDTDNYRRLGAGYDEMVGFVIAAETPHQARNIAQKSGGDEVLWDGLDKKEKGIVFWESPEKATCRVIASETSESEGVVLGSYNSG